MTKESFDRSVYDARDRAADGGNIAVAYGLIAVAHAIVYGLLQVAAAIRENKSK